MPQFAYYDSAAASPAPVLGWYDTDALKYANLPATDSLVEATAGQWAASRAAPSGWTVVKGALVAPAAPTAAQQLAAAKVARKALLAAACRAQIEAGFTSEALGAAYTYPANPTDQQNLAASVLASLMPGLPATWETPLWCADAAAVWARRAHTAAQVQQVSGDGKAAVLAAQQKNDTLSAEVDGATTIAAVQAITW